MIRSTTAVNAFCSFMNEELTYDLMIYNTKQAYLPYYFSGVG